MSTAQRVVKNTIWLYARMGASILANIFTTRILLQSLGASDYGVYNVVGGAIVMLGFLSASMGWTTQRFISYSIGEGNEDNIKRVFNNTMLVHYCLAGISALLLLLASFFLFNGVFNIPDGRKTAALCIYGCLVFSTVYSITIVPYNGILNAHENMRFYSIVGIFDVIIKLLIAVAVSFTSFDQLIFYAVLMALEAWLIRIITKYYCSHHYKECERQELKKYYDRNTVKELTAFAGWNLLNIASAMVALHGTSLVINHYYGTTVNAAIGIATQLSGVLSQISANMVKAISPVLVKNEGAHQRKQVLIITYKSCKFSFLLFLFCCLPFCFFINQILELWLNNVPLYTSIFCLLMITSALFDQIGAVLYQTITASGNIKGFSIAIMFSNIISIFATLIMFSLGFSPYWGFINWLICVSIIGNTIKVFYARKVVGLSILSFFKLVVFPILKVCSIACILLGIAIHVSGYLHINWLIMFIISMLVSLPAYWFAGLTEEERDLLLNLLFKLKVRLF